MQKKVRIDHDVVTCDEQDIIKILHDKFEGETIITPYSIKIKDLMLTCLNTKLEYKLTNITANTGILIMKKAEQK